MRLGLSIRMCGLATLVTILLSLNVGSANSRETRHLYATLSPDLEDLEQFELKIANNLTQALLGSRLLPIRSMIRKLVHRYLIDFYQSTGYSQIKDVIGREQTRASKSPICAYRLIRRSWLLLKNLITQKDFILKFGLLRREIVFFFWRNGWPHFRDHLKSMGKILTLQDAYILEAEKLAQGALLDVKTNCTLSSTSCYEIATVALKAEQFTLALEWLELAKERAQVDKRTSVAFIEFSIWTATDEHNLEFGDKNEDLGPTMYNRRVRYILGDSKRAQKVRNIQYNKFKGKREKSYENFNYWGLCSGENFQTEEEKSFLFCWLEFKLHPGLTIGPLRMEFLARNPDIVQAYEILQDKQLETIISDARKIVGGLGSIKKDKGQASPHSKRLSQAEVIAWTDDASGNVLSDKIRQLSGLRNISPEFQVESFPFGGHYLPRNDQTLLKNGNVSSDPIAHFIFHVNSVDSGGYTVFPSLGVAAKPDKGSVVFWYSQYGDGRTDSSTNYGSCPVLVGQKWVANKWIRSNAILFEQKCGLIPNERCRFPVNSKYLPIPKIVTDADEAEPTANGDPGILAKYSYMSPRALRSLVQLEWNIYPIIKHFYIKYRNQTKGTFREEFDNQNKDVKMYLENFEKCTTNVLGSMDHILRTDTKTVEKVALNLLASYRLVTRFMYYIQTWVQKKSFRDNKLKTKLSSFLATVYNISDGPTENDFEAAMFAVLNIQYIHNLDVKDIVNGIVAGVNTGVTLNARDCWNIGKYTASFPYVVSALNWLEHAEYLARNGSDDSVKYEDVYDDLAALQLDYDCTVYPHNPICHGYTDAKFFGQTGTTDYLQVKFWSMCKGKTFQTEQEKSKLFCWYEREIHPSYKISPVKAEWLSLRPKADVVYFHDIISDRLMNSLINFTYETGRREVFMKHDGELYADPLQRQVLYTWADPHENKAAMYTSELAERITGLKIVNKTMGPLLRISGYAPGGYRAHHHDTMHNLHVATFMFYFSEVDKGGETPFINSGVNVVPRKGSAVFWYNLFTDGITDQSTFHGGCPVIMGEKWASIRWIMYDWQDQLQCDLKPETRFEILVNGKSKYK